MLIYDYEKKEVEYMDERISELRERYTYISKEQKLTEENIKINLIRDVFLKRFGYELMDCTYERDSKGKRSDISVAVHEGKELFFIETKRGDEKLSYENVNQISEYLNRPGMEWGLITNGKEYMLINAKIDPPKDLNNESYKHKIVFWFDIFDLKNKERTNVKYFKYLGYEEIFERRTTTFYRDIAQFKAIAFPNNDRSWATYKSTLNQFFDFLSKQRRSKYRKGILEEINQEDFWEFIKAKQDGDGKTRNVTSKRTIENNYSHISSMFNTLRDSGRITRTFFDRGRGYGLEDFAETKIKKSNNYLNTENVKSVIEYYSNKLHGARDNCMFLLCATMGFERPNIIELTWDDVYLNRKTPYVEVGIRKLDLSPILISCFGSMYSENKREKIKGNRVFNTMYKGKYRPFSESTINGIFDKIRNIGEEEKWKYFSPQYVKICLIDVMFREGYSIDEIIFQTGIDVKNICRYINNKDIIGRQEKAHVNVVKRGLFDGMLETKIEDWK